MGDMGDFYRDVKESRREYREKVGINCPGCNILQPNRTPTILTPGRKCKICGYNYHRAKIEKEAGIEPSILPKHVKQRVSQDRSSQRRFQEQPGPNPQEPEPLQTFQGGR